VPVCANARRIPRGAKPAEFSIFTDNAAHATFTGVAKKELTLDEAQARKDRGVQFLRDVAGDNDAADSLDDEDLDSYIERKHITIVNEGARKMANGTWTKQQLLDEISDLQSQLDAIADIVAPEDEDGDDGTDDGDDYDDGQD
jgi:hypothetical protein